MVSADISEFFSSINIERLMTILNNCGVEAWLTHLLLHILLSWQDQWQTGLPVGPTASFLLAEAALLNVDENLEKEGIHFIRYVDDYRLFAPDLITARRWIEKLIQYLAVEHLNLNHAKTSIDPVTNLEYEALLNARRSARLWGGLQPKADDPRIAQKTPSTPNTPSPQNTQSPKTAPSKKKDPSPVPRHYGKSPFSKTELTDPDRLLLSQIQPTTLLSNLRSHLQNGGHISLGHFRVLAESACFHGDYVVFGDMLHLLDECPYCIPYLVDVLIAEQEQIPAQIRTAASDWFTTRLLSGRCISDHELMHVAVLLGADGYRRPDAVYAYLQSVDHTRSPIAVRALLTVLRIM